MILVTSPFNWHHAVTLTFDLLQSQSCCRVGDLNFPNMLVIDKPAFRTNLNEAVLTGEIPTFINLWWNNCDKAFSIFQNFVKVKVNIICWKKLVLTYVKFFSKVGQNSRSRSQGQNVWYRQKVHVTRNPHHVI